MTNLNSATDFLAHLKSERDALRVFVTLLEKEQQALLNQESDELIELAELKSQAAYKLTELANVRRSRTTGETDDWLQKHAPSCVTVWKEIRALVAQMEQINHINGEVIQLKLRSNQQALSALMGASQGAIDLYGKNGQPSLPSSGRTLGSG